jgi:hypothetical protein
MVWLFIFAAGFRQTLGVSIMPPYDTYVLYEVYINEAAAIRAVALNKLPVTVVTIREGVRALDTRLDEMARVFRFSRKEADLIACPVGETDAGELNHPSLARFTRADAL